MKTAEVLAPLGALFVSGMTFNAPMSTAFADIGRIALVYWWNIPYSNPSIC